jgi:carbonic anhydrase/acetyltransferase-like protein (isoleucine patch superfamily)
MGYEFMKRLREILKTPVKKGKDVFIAPNATVIGQVTLGDEVSVWFGAVLRAEADIIKIGNRTNIQDNAVVHCDPGAPAIIGEDCIIGHLAAVHGAQLGNHVLVGMNSTVLNNAKIGDYCIIGANALVTAATVIPAYSLVVGSPAKVVNKLSTEQVEKIKQNSAVYVAMSKEYLELYK